MSGVATEQRRVLQKIKVSCKTCGVTESFYSNLSVEKFKARHTGHDVTDVSERAAPASAREEKGSPEERKPLERETGMSVAKVIVDMLDFPSLESSILRVRGFDATLEEVFTATLSSSESAKVREMLATGEYFDRDASGLLYIWEPDVVEYVGDVKDKMALMAEAQTEPTGQPGPGPSESQEAIDQATVASASEVLIDTLSGEETGQTSDGNVSDSLYQAPDASENPEEAAPTSPAQPAQELPPEPELTEVRVPSPPAPADRKVKRAVKGASKVAIASAGEAKEDDYLLVSKSWYIQGGKGNRKEAVRVSRVLKAFRWKVEPIYTIGVILDDMLSIETSRSQISGTLIKRIESAGYRLTAVAIDQGKPIAWFKREGSETHPLNADSVAAGLDDSVIELEADVTG